MSKRLNDLGTSVDLKFDTKKIKAQANEILNAEPEERKINVKELKTTNKKAMTNKPYNRQFLQGE